MKNKNFSVDPGEGGLAFRPPTLIAAPSIFSPEGYLETQVGIRFQRSQTGFVCSFLSLVSLI
nr:MAG TPA: hypothetical protein [Caudoviricetes sp.]